MSITFQVKTKILAGHRIEIADPELPEGKSATVFILVEEDLPKRTLREVLANYPGQQLFQTAEQVDAFLRAERESWDK